MILKIQMLTSTLESDYSTHQSLTPFAIELFTVLSITAQDVISVFLLIIVIKAALVGATHKLVASVSANFKVVTQHSF